MHYSLTNEDVEELWLILRPKLNKKLADIRRQNKFSTKQQLL
jgi:hypothetical protein